MKVLSRSRIAVVGLLGAALVMLIALSITTAQEQPILRIGVLDAPRGPLAQGAALAVQQINQNGGLSTAGGTRFRLELVIESTADGDNLDAAIDRLATAGIIAVIGPETTEDVLTHLPQLQSLGVPVLTPAVGDTVLATDTSGQLFRIRAAERLQGSALADYLVNDRNARTVTTVQLDRNSTGGRVGFSIALSELPAPPTETTYLLETDVAALVETIAPQQPPVVVAFGEPSLVATFYNGLVDAGWQGEFAAPEADSRAFRDAVELDRLLGVIATTTWPVSAVDDASARFTNRFIRTYAEAPGELEAAAYDGINLLAVAASRGGSLRQALLDARDVPGVQGTLNPTGLIPHETSNAVAVVEVNALGGPEPAARYAALTRLPPDIPAQIGGTPQPTPTPVPEGVVITIESARQNVRTGPGTEYDILGQVTQGDQFQVIGANLDFTWVVIEYRGQNGWLNVPIADIFGDRSTVGVVAAPPTPTPPPATETPTPAPIPDLIVVAASPANITQGVLTSINVTVRNQGAGPAGPFAVAATFPPDNQFSSVNLNGLAANTETVIQLPVTLSAATGNFNVIIVADLNGQVNEGPVGETNNNTFAFNYKVDRQLILINSITLPLSGQLDLEGNVTPQFDLTFSPAGLDTLAACSGTANCLGLLTPALNWDTAHYDAITSANGINANNIPIAQITPGTTIGILTAEGRRGVIRVDAIQPGTSITLTYRLYS